MVMVAPNGSFQSDAKPLAISTRRAAATLQDQLGPSRRIKHGPIKDRSENKPCKNKHTLAFQTLEK